MAVFVDMLSDYRVNYVAYSPALDLSDYGKTVTLPSPLSLSCFLVEKFVVESG